MFRRWIGERYDLEGVKNQVKQKLVPVHPYDFSYFTGGIVIFLFALQFITGMTLAFYYVPHSEYAYKSIVEIVTKLNMGWFFRSIHHWGAQLAIIALFVHLFVTLFLKSYRKPREVIWVSGFLLLVISIFFGLSGYLLVWDERAFAAVKVATGGAGNLPVIGLFIKAFLRGGTDVTGETLTRFYAFHVSILPILALGLLGLHLLLVQLQGMSVPRSLENKPLKTVRFFPNLFYKDFIIWLLVFGILVTIAALMPPEMGRKADPLAPAPENIKPEWYFLFLFQTLKLFPGELMGLNGETIAICLISCAILFFFLIPFLDRKSTRGEKNQVFTGISVFYLFYFIIMTIVGYLS